MKNYILILLAYSLAAVGMAYIPILAKKLKVSFALLLLPIGFFIFFLGVPIDWPEPIWQHKWVKIITEIIVVISLMGAGLKIGFRYGREHWKNPLRLIYLTMPVYILGIFVLAFYFLGFNGPEALLMAAVCAPTDPVLATDLQLEGDGENGEKNTGLRYLLTAEAGLNDGMAFPFVFFAILWSKTEAFDQINLTEWFSFYLIYKIVVGIIIGSFLGYLYSWSLKKLNRAKDKALSGFIAIALALVAFALAESVLAYGFLSAFFAGLFAQYHNHRKGEEHSKTEMLLYTEETEKFLVTLFILLFGGFLATGILTYISLEAIIAVLLIVLVLRPLSGILAMIPTKFETKKKWSVSFFGIKGIGSIFYLSFALYEGNFESQNELYAIVSLVILASIIVHGITGPRVILYFQKNNPG